MKRIIILFLFSLLFAIVKTNNFEEESVNVDELLQEDFDEEDIIIYKNFVNIQRNIIFNGEEQLDVYYNKNDTITKKPVVIFIYGGSWVTGNKIKYTKFGVLLEQHGYVGVIPNYTLFPEGTVEDMVDDVYKAIQWTYQNIEKYGGDPSQIILSAHSAGAHISALTIVKSTLHQINNGMPLESLPYIKKVVLMSGPYILNEELIIHTFGRNVGNFFKNLFKRGESFSKGKADPKQVSLLPKFLLKYYKDDKISPIAILRKLKSNSITNHFNVGSFTFFYTSLDESVPESSSKNLIKEITRTSKNTICNYVYLEGLEHATIIYGIRDNDTEFENIYLNLLEN
ncbi:alpha/beta-hydrolase [Piromyces finnis]|uniref:Alpha/beta-hydrolase n=1 Tax=Piromyces finnis TaxID=1754191 RepID=A0A1Y1VKT2_9FUNG|nr:alpha/beta-hydrolase [Piromyces finnis]|eukprot:ORX58645.1 alpha/beta-hydrolase [Piromyces finnis]